MLTLIEQAQIIASNAPDSLKIENAILEAQAQHTASILCPQYFEAGKKEALGKVAELLEHIWFKDDSRARFVKEFAQLIDSLKQGKFPEEE